MFLLCKYTLPAVAILLLAACRSPSNLAGGGAAGGGTTFPQTTSVGPIPGDSGSVHDVPDQYMEDPVALQEGKRLFGWYNCAGCHGIHGGGGMGPSLRDAVWIYGGRADQIMDTLIHGRSNGMPAWGTKIPEGQMGKIVAYIKSMNTPLEPDAPVTPPEEQIPSSDIYPASARPTQPR